MRRVSYGLVLAALMVGCGGDGGSVDKGTEPTDTDVAVNKVLLGLGLAPNDPDVALGRTVSFQAKAFYEDTSYEDVTGTVTWTVSDERVLSINAQGVAEALAEGSAEVVATHSSGISSKVKVTVKGKGIEIESIAITPSSVDIGVGDWVQLQADALFEDKTEGNVAGSCVWSVGDSNIASIGEIGEVQGLAEGSTQASIACGDVSASVPITVRGEDAAPPTGNCDLVVSNVDSLVTGDAVLWLVDVTNQGDALCASSFVDVYLDGSAPSPGDAGVANAVVSDLAPGDTQDVLLSHTTSLTGSLPSWAGVDMAGLVPESNDNNNVSAEFTVDVGTSIGPDLAITSFTVTQQLAGGVQYEIVVENLGDQVATDFWIDLYTNPASSPMLCDLGDEFQMVSQLAPGSTYTWAPVITPGPSGSDWLSEVWVDNCDDFAEPDEDNNRELLIVSGVGGDTGAWTDTGTTPGDTSGGFW